MRLFKTFVIKGVSCDITPNFSNVENSMLRHLSEVNTLVKFKTLLLMYHCKPTEQKMVKATSSFYLVLQLKI